MTGPEDEESVAGGQAPPAADDHKADPEPSRPRMLPSPRQLVGLVVLLVVSYATVLIVVQLRSILVMLLVSVFISFAVEPAVQYLGRRWGWRRGAATGVVFAVSILAIGASLGSIVPLLIDQVAALLRSAPSSVAELNELLADVPFIDFQLDPTGDVNQELLELSRGLTGEGGGSVASSLLGAAGDVAAIGRTAVEIIFQGLTILLVSFYLVADGPRFRATLARPLPQNRQRELLAIWEIAVTKTGGYIYSRVLLAGLAAAVTGTFLAILQVPYPLPLGLWVGVTGAFIPVVGTYLGGILVMLVAVTDEPVKALWVLAFIVVYQQVENYLVAPRLQAATMDVHPALAFVSVLVGASLLGAVGALLALPATAIIQAVISTYAHRNELIDELVEASAQLDQQLSQSLPPLDLGSAKA